MSCPSNAFLNLDGVPYLLGAYLDRSTFQMVDRGAIQTGIYVDTEMPMRAIIDIQVDDIGKKNQQGDLNVLTNRRQIELLLEGVRQMALHGKTQLPVLDNSLIARVNYRLEQAMNGKVLRSMTEDLRITNRSCYLDISSSLVDDQALISNFSDTIVSTINQFTYGQEKMILRITSIQLFYELYRPDAKMPAIRKEACNLNQTFQNAYPNLQQYHEAIQSHHFIGTHHRPCYPMTPPDWSFFEYFYHFEQDGHIIALHMPQLMDPRVNKVNIPCGKIDVNQMFVVNPGQRILFKFSIWKNDLVLMQDTMAIARLLRAPVHNNPHYHHHWCPNPDHYHDMMDNCMQGMQMDYNQNAVINQISGAVTDLQAQVAELVKQLNPDSPVEDPDDTGSIPILPERPTDPTDPIQILIQNVNALTEKVNDLTQKVDQYHPSTEPGEEEDPSTEDPDGETPPSGSELDPGEGGTGDQDSEHGQEDLLPDTSP